MELQPDTAKVIAAMAFVIAEAERRGRAPSQYDVVKSLFLADRAHLNRYGRPVTFDNYWAMEHGPVPNLAYDLLKHGEAALRRIGCSAQALPWKRRQDQHSRAFRYYDAHPDESVLSESDLDALHSAVSTMFSLSFGQIRRLTHQDPAYAEAWNDEADAKSFQMSLGMLFDSPNFEAAEHVAFLSRHR